MGWLDRNPLVEFHAVDKVFSPLQIGRNPQFVAVLPARKVDLSGRIALQFGKGMVTAGTEEVSDFVNGAELSEGGRTVFALPSRSREGEANIRISVEDFPNQFSIREMVDMVVTEYGVANLTGRTVRERAQALIEIAHPDDRPKLIEQAKAQKIIYQDQIFLPDSAYFYPAEVATEQTFKGGVEVRFRVIKPSDEEEMRRLFYRFSDEAVYYRYFTSVKTMPHSKMQEYVNIDYRRAMSIVGLVGELGQERIIAEARYIKEQLRPYADVAFVVDEEYQGLGIATYLYNMLIRIAREQEVLGFTADVLASNKSMMKVFEKAGLPFKARMESGVYELTIPFEGQPSPSGETIQYEHRR
jgi:GNAT superfamily N-acetyltransferase